MTTTWPQGVAGQQVRLSHILLQPMGVKTEDTCHQMGIVTTVFSLLSSEGLPSEWRSRLRRLQRSCSDGKERGSSLHKVRSVLQGTICLFILDTVLCVAQAGLEEDLELLVLPSPPLECYWNYKCAPLCPVYGILGIKPRACCAC